MNVIFVLLITIFFVYIVGCALKYATQLMFNLTFSAIGLSLTHHYFGESAMIIALIISPVLFIAGSSFIEFCRGLTLPSASMTPLITSTMPGTQLVTSSVPGTQLMESDPLTGEWISAKTPKLDFQRIKLGNHVEALPEPWL